MIERSSSQTRGLNNNENIKRAETPKLVVGNNYDTIKEDAFNTIKDTFNRNDTIKDDKFNRNDTIKDNKIEKIVTSQDIPQSIHKKATVQQVEYDNIESNANLIPRSSSSHRTNIQNLSNSEINPISKKPSLERLNTNNAEGTYSHRRHASPRMETSRDLLPIPTENVVSPSFASPLKSARTAVEPHLDPSVYLIDYSLKK